MTTTEVPPVPASNRTITLRYRDQVLKHLRSRGLVVGRPLLPASGPHMDSGEIDGINNWTVIARRQQRLDLSECADLAKDRAAKAGTPYVATVLHRRSHETQESYVLLSLAVFADLLTSGRSQKGQP